MAAKAKLSVLGLYQWDHSIFANMAIPEDVDGEILTWKILEDCAELEILYSDPEYMKASLHNWSSAMLPNWNKMQEALTAEYNPIWNKDGTIKEYLTYGAESETYISGAQINSQTIGPRTQEQTHQVAGYNSDTLNNADKDIASTQQAVDQENIGTREDRATKTAHTDTVERIEQGNIGVTESSAMVMHEVELRKKFNIYEIITADFKNHYCLQIY